MSLTQKIALLMDDDARIADTETKLADAREAADRAYQASCAAKLAAVEVDDAAAAKRRAKAAEEYDAALARVSELEDVLNGAKARRDARNAAAATKAARAHQANGREALERLQTAAGEVDRAADALAVATMAAMKAIDDARRYVASTEFSSAIATANYALNACIAHRLRFVPSMKQAPFFDDQKARWAGYMPSPDLADRLAANGQNR